MTSPTFGWQKLSAPIQQRLLVADLDQLVPDDLAPHLYAAGLFDFIGTRVRTHQATGHTVYYVAPEVADFVQTKKEEAGL